MPALSFTAPGKTILFGEHAVVYGHPAIAVPVDSIGLNIKIFPTPDSRMNSIYYENPDTNESSLISDLPGEHFMILSLNTLMNILGVSQLPSMIIQVTSSIPLAAGMGSSAAFAVALCRAIFAYLGFNKSVEEINAAAFEIEKINHGSPSGIDNTVVAYNRAVYFEKSEPIRFIDIPKDMNLIFADSGMRVPTKEMVTEVHISYQKNRNKISKLLDEIGEVVKLALDAITEGDIEDVGNLMVQNHHLLQNLGVSSGILDKLVNTVLSHNALGAKLCGGGRGGSIVAISHPNDVESIINCLLDAGAKTCFGFLLKNNNRD